MHRIQKDGPNELICRAAVETQAQGTGLWAGGAGEGEGWTVERGARRHTHHWKRARANLWCDSGSSHRCSVTTWGGGRVGWDVGGRYKREGTYVH